MKNFTTVLVFSFFVSVGAFAQGVSGGVKAGLNLANQTYTYTGSAFTSSPDFLPGIHAGAYLTAMFTGHFGVQPELLFSAQGAKSGDSKVKLGYVTVPVLVRYNVNSLISFHAGPQFGFLASAKNQIGSTKEDIKDDVKGSDLGIAAGMGFDLPIKLNFSLRFIKGLSDINEDGGNFTAKNYNVQLSVGYKLFGK